MNLAEWIIVAILSVTLLLLLILAIILMIKLIKLSKEVENIVVEGQDIAKNANGIVSNIKGMTSFGGTFELFMDKYITPKLKEKIKEAKAKESKERSSDEEGKK